MTPHRITSAIGAATVACLSFTAPAIAQGPSNVLLIVNEASADSVRIAEHYAKRRNIPSGNILRLRAAVSDDIDRREYERTIEMPIASWIASH